MGYLESRSATIRVAATFPRGTSAVRRSAIGRDLKWPYPGPFLQERRSQGPLPSEGGRC